jgi:hypothetical protein
MTNYPTFTYISAITNQKNAVVTMTADHDFTDGEIVSFRVGKQFGMPEINNKKTRILETTSDTITTDIDTSTWGTFSLDNIDTAGTTPPVCIPSSSGVIPNNFIPTVNIKDAFDVLN